MSRAPLLIAHRGMPGRFQNSRRGVERALAAGYPGLEVDVVLTADGVLMLSHDPWLHDELVTDIEERPLPSRQLIKDSSWADIKAQYLVGGPPSEDEPEPSEPPMCLDEVLELLADRPEVLLYLDVKIEEPETELTRSPEDYAKHIFACLREAGLPNPTWVEAPTAEIGAIYHAHRGELDVYFVLSYPRFTAGQTRMSIGGDVLDAVRDDPVDMTVEAQLHGFAAPWMVVRTWEAARSTEAGLTNVLYGVDNPRELDILDNWPDTMLIVDHWDGVFEAFAARGRDGLRDKIARLLSKVLRSLGLAKDAK